MEGQVPDSEKAQRANVIKEISRKKYDEFINKNIGKPHELLIEKHRDKHSGNLKGVTENYLTVEVNSDREDLYNTLQPVVITEYKQGKIYGKLL